MISTAKSDGGFPDSDDDTDDDDDDEGDSDDDEEKEAMKMRTSEYAFNTTAKSAVFLRSPDLLAVETSRKSLHRNPGTRMFV